MCVWHETSQVLLVARPKSSDDALKVTAAVRANEEEFWQRRRKILMIKFVSLSLPLGRPGFIIDRRVNARQIIVKRSPDTSERQ